MLSKTINSLVLITIEQIILTAPRINDHGNKQKTGGFSRFRLFDEVFFISLQLGITLDSFSNHLQAAFPKSWAVQVNFKTGSEVGSGR